MKHPEIAQQWACRTLNFIREGCPGGPIIPQCLLDVGTTGFDYDPDRLIAALETGRHDAILLANPQNPTGALCDRAVLLEIIQAAAGANVHVLLDEAFIDYVLESVQKLTEEPRKE